MILKGFAIIMSGPLTSLAVGGLEPCGVLAIVEIQLLEIGRVRLGRVLGMHRGDEVRCLEG